MGSVPVIINFYQYVYDPFNSILLVEDPLIRSFYAVRRDIRGEHIGEKLVKDCLSMAHEKGFRILQFNAVVANNIHAIHLYERLGFKRIGTVQGGFHMPDGTYEDIILFFHTVC